MGIGAYAAGIGAAATGGAVAWKLTEGRDPWTLDWPKHGPGSIEQAPSMLLPYQLPTLGAGLAALTLAERGNTAAAKAVGLGAALLYGAGFATWLRGKATE
jgi:hypothetical protein